MGEGQLSAISRQHSAKPRRQLRRKLLPDTPGKEKGTDTEAVPSSHLVFYYF
jgi:hypothetical protein